MVSTISYLHFALFLIQAFKHLNLEGADPVSCIINDAEDSTSNTEKQRGICRHTGGKSGNLLSFNQFNTVS